MALNGVLETYDKDVAASGTPEDIAKGSESGVILASDIVIKAKATNIGTIFLGDAASQTWPLIAGEAISISDFFRTSIEVEFDFKKAFIRVGTNGDGFHVLRTKVL